MGLGLVNLDLSTIGELAKDLRSAITGEISSEKKAELESAIWEIESKLALAQINVNNTEAKSASLFVSGWRPFIGWICGFSLMYHYIINRLIEWYVVSKGGDISVPSFDLGDLIVILGGLLGIAGMRTYEKGKRVARN